MVRNKELNKIGLTAGGVDNKEVVENSEDSDTIDDDEDIPF